MANWWDSPASPTTAPVAPNPVTPAPDNNLLTYYQRQMAARPKWTPPDAPYSLSAPSLALSAPPDTQAPTAPEAKAPEAPGVLGSTWNALKGAGVEALKTTQSIGPALYGLADTATGGYLDIGRRRVQAGIQNALGDDTRWQDIDPIAVSQQRTGAMQDELKPDQYRQWEQDVAQQQGAWDKTKATLSHPGLMVGKVAGLAPYLLGGELGLGAKATTAGFGALMGGQSALDAQARVYDKPLEDLQKLPDYRPDQSEADNRARLAQQAARPATALGAAAGVIPGAIAGKALHGPVTALLGGAEKVAASLPRTMAQGVLQQAPEFAAMNAGTTLAGNVGLRAVDPNQPLMENVPETVAEGLLVGGLSGMAVHPVMSRYQGNKGAKAYTAVLDQVHENRAAVPDTDLAKYVANGQELLSKTPMGQTPRADLLDAVTRTQQIIVDRQAAALAQREAAIADYVKQQSPPIPPEATLDPTADPYGAMIQEAAQRDDLWNEQRESLKRNVAHLEQLKQLRVEQDQRAQESARLEAARKVGEAQRQATTPTIPEGYDPTLDTVGRLPASTLPPGYDPNPSASMGALGQLGPTRLGASQEPSPLVGLLGVKPPDAVRPPVAALEQNPLDLLRQAARPDVVASAPIASKGQLPSGPQELKRLLGDAPAPVKPPIREVTPQTPDELLNRPARIQPREGTPDAVQSENAARPAGEDQSVSAAADHGNARAADEGRADEVRPAESAAGQGQERPTGQGQGQEVAPAPPVAVGHSTPPEINRDQRRQEAETEALLNHEAPADVSVGDFITSRPKGLQKIAAKALQADFNGASRAEQIRNAIAGGASVAKTAKGRTLGAWTEKQLTSHGMDYAEALTAKQGGVVAPAAKPAAPVAPDKVELPVNPKRRYTVKNTATNRLLTNPLTNQAHEFDSLEQAQKWADNATRNSSASSANRGNRRYEKFVVVDNQVDAPVVSDKPSAPAESAAGQGQERPAAGQEQGQGQEVAPTPPIAADSSTPPEISHDPRSQGQQAQAETETLLNQQPVAPTVPPKESLVGLSYEQLAKLKSEFDAFLDQYGDQHSWVQSADGKMRETIVPNRNIWADYGHALTKALNSAPRPPQAEPPHRQPVPPDPRTAAIDERVNRQIAERQQQVDTIKAATLEKMRALKLEAQRRQQAGEDPQTIVADLGPALTTGKQVLDWLEQRAFEARDQRGYSVNLRAQGATLSEIPDWITRHVESVESKESAPTQEGAGKSPATTKPRQSYADKVALHETDDLLTAIAKMGGIDRASAKREGIDPSEFKRMPVFGKPLFRKTGGRSMDTMAEVLSEAGYPVLDENGYYTVNRLLDQLDAALRGEQIYTPKGYEDMARREAEDRQRQQEADDWALDDVELEASGFNGLADLEQAIADWKVNARKQLGVDKADALFERIAEKSNADSESEFLQELNDAYSREMENGGGGRGSSVRNAPEESGRAATGESPEDLNLSGYSQADLDARAAEVARAQAEQSAKDKAADQKAATARQEAERAATRRTQEQEWQRQREAEAARREAERAAARREREANPPKRQAPAKKRPSSAKRDDDIPPEFVPASPAKIAIADALRQERKDGKIDTLTLIKKLADQAVNNDMPLGLLYNHLQAFNDWGEGQVATALYDAGMSSADLNDLGFKAEASLAKARENRRKDRSDQKFSAATPASLTAQLKTLSSDATVRPLIDNGRLKLVAKQSELPRSARIPPGQRVAGWVDPQTGVVYLVTDNITQAEVDGLLSHEIGVHQSQLGLNQPKPRALRLAHAMVRLLGGRAILGDPGFEQVLKQVEQMRAAGNVRVVAAFEEAQKAAGKLNQSPALLREEALAYLVQNQPQLPLVRRIMAAIRATLYRMGLKISLTEADLRSLAQSAVRRAAAERAQPALTSINAALQRASQAPQDVEAQRQFDAVVARYTLPDGTKAPGWMKAPNGQPTKLNERQWVQVRTENFKRWFDGSKVVDENGEPLVVYHGTNADFDAFIPHSMTPVYRADGQEIQKANSWDYGDDAQGMPEGYHYGALSDVLMLGAEEAFNLRKADFDRYPSASGERHLRDIQRLRGKTLTVSDESRPSGDGSYFTPDKNYSFIRDIGTRDGGQVLPVFLNIKNPAWVNASEVESAGRDWKIEKYRAKGHDGAIYASDRKNLSDPGWNSSTQIVAFSPTQIKSALSNTGAFSAENPDIRYATAWHGTPHTFEAEDGAPLGRFRMEKLGTGEGAQVFGHGLYFTEKRKIGEGYRDGLSAAAPAAYEWRGHRYEDGPIKHALSLIYNDGLPYTRKLAKQWANDAANNADEKAYFQTLLDTVNNVGSKSEIKQHKGRLYQAHLKPADDAWLLWDKPLTAQSKRVKAAIDGNAILKSLAAERKEDGSQKTGEDLYRELSSKQGGDQAASDYLATADIPGMKYLTGDSRAKGKGDYNYVVFRDGDVEVMQRFALARPQPAHGTPLRLAQAAADKVAARLPESAKEFGRRILEEAQLWAAPMAAGTARTQAPAKDYANGVRRTWYEATKTLERLTQDFTPKQHQAMWTGMDATSVWVQQQMNSGMDRDAAMRAAQAQRVGVFALPAAQRDAALALSTRADALWKRAKDAGMVQDDAQGLPFWTPRVAAIIGEDGSFGKPPGKNEGVQNPDHPGIGFTTTSPNLKHRGHVFAADSEAGMQKLFGDKAALVRDIRVMPLAMARLEQAIAGRELINQVNAIGKAIGAEVTSPSPKRGYFTLDHPAFQTFVPRIERQANGAWEQVQETVTDADGHTTLRPAFEKQPLYIAKEFEGPLRAVLNTRSGAIYQGLMGLKRGAMSLVMFSPMIHNAVIWGKAFPAMPGKMITGKIYFEGNRAKRDPSLMKEAIGNGLAPINSGAFHPDVPTGLNSLSGHEAGLISTALSKGVGLVNKSAGAALAKGLDQLGGFWHNTMLWDRIADLQMGLYVNLKQHQMDKGLDAQSAGRVAAHFANRYAGAIPQEAMGEGARRLGNLALFSRSFTLGNLAIMKDMLTGLPQDVKAQILRDAGQGAMDQATAAARKKAWGMLAADIGLMYVGNALLQGAVDKLKLDKSLDEIGQGYARRLDKALKAADGNPLQLVNPWSAAFLPDRLSPGSEHEPGKEDRIFTGRDPRTGTASYTRLPTGKVGEELLRWPTRPLEMLRKKQSTLLRPTMEIFANRDHFNNPVYDADAPGLDGMVQRVGQVVGHFLSGQAPVEEAGAAYRSLTGQAVTGDTLKWAGPLMGFTAGRGYPGGPELGAIATAERRHADEIKAMRPEIKRLVDGGQVQEAVRQMTRLGMSPTAQRALIVSVVAPQSKLNSGALMRFYRNATAEEKAKLQDVIDAR